MLHGEERADHDQEGAEIDQVDDGRAGEGEDRSADGGSGHRGDLEHRHVEAERVRKLLRADEPRDQGLAGGVVERSRGPRQHGERVDRVGRRAARVREPGERQRDDRQHALGDEHDPPSVERVREDAAAERQGGDGEDAEEAEDAESERRPGQ